MTTQRMFGSGIIGLAVLTVAVASTASADTTTNPADRGMNSPQVSSPYWNASGNDQTQAANFGEGLMEKTVLAVPGARADAVVAQWQYRRVNNTLNITADNMRRDFLESDEYSAAVDAFKDAYRNLENARLDALKGLRTSADYAAIESMRKSINAQIADERDQEKPSAERLNALAELKLQSIAPVRSAEQDTIENSGAVRDAKARLIDAAKKVAKIEREFAHDVRDSIELSDARKAKEDARIAMLASSAYLDETRTARDIAVRYSYLSRGLYRTDVNGFSPYNGSYSGYGYGGYGYGGYGGGGGYYGGVNYGLGNTGFISGGVTGSTDIGAGTNAFTGRGGNSITGPGPSSARQSGMPSAPGSNVSHPPFGPSSGGGIPGPFGNGTAGPDTTGK